MSVHYKFKSSKDAHTVTFDGLHISVADLKKAIMQQKKIGKSADLDLEIINAQTKEVYQTDTTLIPKNTSVIVSRVPVSGATKKSWDRFDNASKNASTPSYVDVDKITKSSNLSSSDAPEDQKIKAMMSQSTQDYDPSKYVKSRGMTGPLPPNYTCFRCGQPGHFIKLCPMNNMDVKRSTGIPRSFMIPANPDQKGALLTASGEYAVPIIDHEAYKEVKKEKPPFVEDDEEEDQTPVAQIPEELKCTLCHDLLQDAVLIHCCGNSYCDDCIRTNLLESDTHECPTCHEVGISPDTLIPNRYLRAAVTNFRNETGYTRSKYFAGGKPAQNKTIEAQDLKEEPQQEQESKQEVEDKSEVTNESDQNGLSEEKKSPVDDVTLDEVLLSTSEKLDNDLDPLNDIPIKSDETSAISAKDSQDSESCSTTPLVDEIKETDSEQLPNDDATQQVQPVIPVTGSGRTRTSSRLPQSSGSSVPMGPSQPIMTRPHILPHPQRLMVPRGYAQDPNYYRPPLRDPRAGPFPMGMTPVPYGYPPMRPQNYQDPYGYMGPHPYLPPHPMSMHHSIVEAPPPGTSENDFSVYDDYEERLNKFTKQLESRSVKRRRSRTRSRTRRTRRRSRSRSRLSSSWRSSSSKSEEARSHDSRSRSPRPRRRSRSPSSHRRYSRSPRRHAYKYRRSRSRNRSRSPKDEKSKRIHKHRHHHKKEKDKDKEKEKDDQKKSPEKEKDKKEEDKKRSKDRKEKDKDKEKDGERKSQDKEKENEKDSKKLDQDKEIDDQKKDQDKEKENEKKIQDKEKENEKKIQDKEKEKVKEKDGKRKDQDKELEGQKKDQDKEKEKDGSRKDLDKEKDGQKKDQDKGKEKDGHRKSHDKEKDKEKDNQRKSHDKEKIKKKEDDKKRSKDRKERDKDKNGQRRGQDKEKVKKKEEDKKRSRDRKDKEKDKDKDGQKRSLQEKEDKEKAKKKKEEDKKRSKDRKEKERGKEKERVGLGSVIVLG